MDKALRFDGKKYISAKNASKIFGYTSDYVGQLCRGKKIRARLVGRSWYVCEKDILNHKKSQDHDYGLKNASSDIKKTKKKSKKFYTKPPLENIRVPVLSPRIKSIDALNDIYFNIGKSRIAEPDSPKIVYLKDDNELFPKIVKKFDSNTAKHIVSKSLEESLKKPKSNQFLERFVVKSTLVLLIVSFLGAFMFGREGSKNAISTNFAGRVKSEISLLYGSHTNRFKNNFFDINQNSSQLASTVFSSNSLQLFSGWIKDKAYKLIKPWLAKDESVLVEKKGESNGGQLIVINQNTTSPVQAKTVFVSSPDTDYKNYVDLKISELKDYFFLGPLAPNVNRYYVTRQNDAIVDRIAGSSAGVTVINGGTSVVSDLAFTYPLINTADTISLAFGTTTNNSWSGLQQFNGNASTTQLTSTDSVFLATLGGKVGIGTTNPGVKFDVLNGDIRMTTSLNGAASYWQNFYRSRGTELSPTIVNENDEVGVISGRGYDGSIYRYMAQINFNVDGTPGSWDMPGRITFSTTPDNGSNVIERMRITNAGKVGIGTTTPYSKLSVWGGTTGNILEAVNSASTTVLSVSAEGFGTTTLAGLNISGQATSTSNVGFNLSEGCFAINGTCISGGTGTGLSSYDAWTHPSYGGSATTSLLILSNGFLSTASSTIVGQTNLMGNVGVGTSSPSQLLTVGNNNQFTVNTSGDTVAGYITTSQGGVGRLNLANVSYGLQNIGTGGVDLFSNYSSGYIRFTTNNVERIRIDANGNVGIGTTSPFAKLSISNYSDGASTLPLFVVASSTGVGATSTAFMIDSAGNVGVKGVPNQAYSLDVNGRARIGTTLVLSPTPRLSVTTDQDEEAFSIYSIGSQSNNVISAILDPQTYPATLSSTLISGEFEDGGITSNTNITGNMLDLHRNLTAFGSTVTVSGDLASFFDSCSDVIGQCISNSDVVSINQNATVNTGSALNVTTVATGAGALALRINDDGTFTDATPFVVDAIGNVGIGTTSPFAKLAINPEAGDGNSFVIGSSTATKFVVTNAGKVGIGIANPSYMLDLNASGAGLNIRNLTSTNQTSTGIHFGNASAPDTADISVGSASYTLGGGPNSLNITAYGGSITFRKASLTTVGNEFMRITNAGNIGIGTTTPLARLNVYGGDTVLQTPTDSLTAFNILNSATSSVFSVATSGFGTTTLAGLNISGQATSTSNVGINLTGGCFAINGTCISGGTGTGLSSYDAWTHPSYGGSATTSLLTMNGFLSTASSTQIGQFNIIDGNVGIGTTTPPSQLTVSPTPESLVSLDPVMLLGTSTLASPSANGTYIGANAPSGFGGNFLTFQNNGTTKFKMDSNGIMYQGATNSSGYYISSVMFRGSYLGGNVLFSNVSNAANSGINLHTTSATGPIVFSPRSVEAARFTGDGLLGIGTTSPFAKLSISNYSDGANTAPLFVIASSTGTSATSTAFIVSSTGNVGIGTTTPAAKLDILGTSGPILQLSSETGQTVFNYQTANDAWWAGNIFSARRSRGTLSSPTAISNDDIIFQIESYGHNGTNWNSQSAGIWMRAAGDFSPSSMPSYMTFLTHPANGDAAPTERMRIDKDGKVGIGATSPDSLLNLYASGSNEAFLHIQSAGTQDARLRIDSPAARDSWTYFEQAASLKAAVGYRNSTQTLSLYESGSDRLTIKNGNVGIGTAVPGALLDIHSDAAAALSRISWDATNQYGELAFYEGSNFKGAFTAIGSNYPTVGIRDQFRFVNSSNNTGAINFITQTGGTYYDRLFIQNNGNIGIGTTTPFAKLAINPVAGDGHSFVIGSSTATQFVVTNGGNVGIGTASPISKLDVAGSINIDASSSYKQAGNTILHTIDDRNSLLLGLNVGTASISGTGRANIAIGKDVLQSPSFSGNRNIGVGYQTLYSNTTGDENNAFGVYSLYENTKGIGNSAFGFLSLSNNITGNFNTAVGNYALEKNTSATNTVAVGYSAGRGLGAYSNQGSVYIGYQAGLSAGNNSNYNTMVGYQAGYEVSTGSHNINIGQNVTSVSNTGAAQLNIGNVIYGTGMYSGSSVSSSSVSTSTIGIGTSTPSSLARLTVASTTGSQLSLSEGAGLAQWTFRNAGGNLYFSTTTVAGTATTSISALEIAGSGFGTTTVRGLNISAQATSTSNVGFNLSEGCFAINGTCISGGTGTGLSSYDAWTHPAYGGSATTSLLTMNGFLSTASSTQIGQFNIIDGNVGIGTTSPSVKLQVAAGASDSGIKLTGKSDNSVYGYLGYNNGNGTFIQLQNEAGDSNVTLRSYGVSYFNGGNVGIGTTDPGTNQLLVYQAGAANSYIGMQRSDNNYDAANTYIPAGDLSSSNVKWLAGLVGTSNNYFIRTWDGSTVVNPFVITNTGNVGVGTTTPDATLTVVGRNGVGTSAITGPAPVAFAVYGGAGAKISSTIGAKGGDIILQGGNGGNGGPMGGGGNGGNLYLVGGGAGTASGGSVGAAGNVILGVTEAGLARGNIGIGTTSPWAKLSVSSYTDSGVANTLPLFIIASSTGTSATSTAFIVSSTGNVGIGSSNPSAPLHISADSNPLLKLARTNTVGGSALIQLIEQGGSTGDISMTGAASSFTGLLFRANGSRNDLFIQNSTGNVGVGATTPSSPFTLGITSAQLVSTNPVMLLGTSTLASASANGTYIGLNAPTGFAGNYMNIQQNGTSMFRISPVGNSSASLNIGSAGNWSLTPSSMTANFGLGTMGGGASIINFASGNGNLLDAGNWQINLMNLGTTYAPSSATLQTSVTSLIVSENFLPSAAASTVTGRWVGAQINPIFGNNKQDYNSTNPIGTYLTGLEVSPTVNVKTTSIVGYAGLIVNPLEINTSSSATNYIALFQNSSSTKVAITSTGFVGIGTTSIGSMLDIASSTSASDGDLFRVISDVGAAGNVKFRIDSDGDTFTDGTQTIGTPADLAENYPVFESDIEAGDVVALGSEKITLINKEETGAQTDIAGLIKASSGHKNILGVVSTKPGLLLAGYTESSAPVALAGRVPVKVSVENGPIYAGDYLTLSSVTPGVATKAVVSGMTIGIALEDYPSVNSRQTYSSTNTVLMFVRVGWQNIEMNNAIVLDSQKGQLSGSVGNPNELSSPSNIFVGGLLANQNGSGYILQLQSEGQDRFTVANNGSVNILADTETETENVFAISNASSFALVINARGDLKTKGIIVFESDSAAGSIATDDTTGLAEVDFGYSLGTGKPVIQLTPEGDVPTIAQVTSWKKDNAGNYIGFFIKTFGLNGQTQAANVHYAVFGKQDGYVTRGNALPILTNVSDNYSSVPPSTPPSGGANAGQTPEVNADEGGAPGSADTSQSASSTIPILEESAATTTPVATEPQPAPLPEPASVPEQTTASVSSPDESMPTI